MRRGRVSATAFSEHSQGGQQSMIGFIVAGLIIGLLARLILPGRQHIGLLWTIVLGIVGSVIGGTIANLIGSGDIMELNVFGFIVAVIAAVALLSVADRAQLGSGRQQHRLRWSSPAGPPLRGGARGECVAAQPCAEPEAVGARLARAGELAGQGAIALADAALEAERHRRRG